MKKNALKQKSLTKQFAVSMLVVFSTLAVQAKTLPSSKQSISPAEVDQVIRLAEKKDIGSYNKKVSIIVTDHGLSTDVSPRYSVYLGFASFAEMGNISANFLVNDQAFKFISASRKSAGIYEIKVIEYRGDGMYEVTQELDATKMFSDEQKLRKDCGADFCDQNLKTSISTKETAKKLP
jgi:hypothetical protein